MGTINSAATFQRLMDAVLNGLAYQVCLAYLDDVIIFSRDLESHLVRMREVLLRLAAAGLKLKPSKCHM
jgi:hypothetical protein